MRIHAEGFECVVCLISLECSLAPPPFQQVKVVFSEQLSKLQTKQHQNSDLLEEIRSFSKQRAAIEKEYGQVSAQNLFESNAGSVSVPFYQNPQTATSRLAAAEEYHSLIGQASKRQQVNTIFRHIKSADTQNRKSEHGMFHFKSGLHKMNAKLSAQLKECDDRLTEARNEYLLTLAAINAQLQYYYTQDLPMIMEVTNTQFYYPMWTPKILRSDGIHHF
uniref:FCH domain-containing protein n=1 Tax=Kryptolebias marmoratus TaxID=37003 RepID=A0A3Q3FB21_KRYMA